jgi:hypothetical protein
LIWRFTLVLIKINYGQIGDQTGLFYTTNPVFYTSGNRFVRRTGTFGNLIFSLVPSDNRNTRSTCPTSVFTGIGQTLMSRPALHHTHKPFTPFHIYHYTICNAHHYTIHVTPFSIHYLLVVSSNLFHGEVYSIQHYVIKFVSDLRQVGGFLWFHPPIKLTATK